MQAETKNNENVKPRELKPLFSKFIRVVKPRLPKEDQNNTPNESYAYSSTHNTNTRNSLFYEQKAPYFVRLSIFDDSDSEELDDSDSEERMIQVLKNIDYEYEKNNKSCKNMGLLTTLFLNESEKKPRNQHDTFKQINEEFNKWCERVTLPG